MPRPVSALQAAQRAKTADKKARAAATRKTLDSFQNFAAKLGLGTDNISSGGSYGYNPITRVRTLLEWIHRGSWLGGIAIDVVADDMTKQGVEFKGDLEPKQIEQLQRVATTFDVWGMINETVKWSRLYGGCIAVMLIDGQLPETPLRLDTVSKGQFRGLMVLDRWMIEPSMETLVTEPGPDMGLPKYYRVVADAPALRRMKIHYSRCLRLEGVRLPYWQKVQENFWGISVLERLYDRMIAFDSATTGAAQLVYKSYLRTYKIDKLREIIATGGAAEAGLLKYVQMMTRFQNIEGITLLDATDEFEAQTHGAFAGLSDALLQFGQQLSGALQIPLVRLFGQSPAGLNSTGESDLRMYYDGITQQQNRHLYTPVVRIYRCIAASEGIKLNDSFTVEFKPLWIMNSSEKAALAGQVAAAVTQVDQAGITSKETALKELRQSSRVTGIFSNISDEDIARAKLAPPPGAAEAAALQQQEQSMEHADRDQDRQDEPPEPETAAKKKAKSKDRRRTKDAMLGDRRVMGFPVVIEHIKGESRYGVNLPADYGYIRRTGGADAAQIDCFVGPDVADGRIFVVDAYERATGKFNEHKCMLGYTDREAALAAFRAYYGRMTDFNLIGYAGAATDEQGLRAWLAEPGAGKRPYTPPTDVQYVPVTSGEMKCSNCEHYDTGICTDAETQRDPRVPETRDGLKLVMPTGWCKEFEVKVSARK